MKRHKGAELLAYIWWDNFAWFIADLIRPRYFFGRRVYECCGGGCCK